MSPKKNVTLDKYARNARAWKDSGDTFYRAATLLFQTRDLLLIFPAAILGHHALERYLKAALIREGYIVFNPRDINRLDPPIAIQEADCAWDHDLVVLARQLSAKRPDFKLSDPMIFLLTFDDPPEVPTVENGFEVFTQFFYELRFPHELTLSGVGEDNKWTLDELVEYLRPFLATIK
jgi:hypothetical protein